MIEDIGYSNTQEFLEQHWWSFETHRQPGADDHYTEALFVWQANPMNNQSERCGTLTVAVGFSHYNLPSIVKLQIKGKLIITPRNIDKDITLLMTQGTMEQCTRPANTL